MSPGRNNPATADGHAILADRVFDGHGWHAEAAVLVRDGRVAGLGAWSEVSADWPQTRLPRGVFLAVAGVLLTWGGDRIVSVNVIQLRWRS